MAKSTPDYIRMAEDKGYILSAVQEKGLWLYRIHEQESLNFVAQDTGFDSRPSALKAGWTNLKENILPRKE